MLKAETLDAAAYFFLLHLLIAMASGKTMPHNRALRIVNYKTDSPGYPDDIFVNRLVYLALLDLADPAGGYAWNNARLQTTLKDIDALILGVPQAQRVIKASLAQHLKMLHVDSAYPMHDPYNPSVGFTQRKTDTLAALDRTRAGLKEEID